MTDSDRSSMEQRSDLLHPGLLDLVIIMAAMVFAIALLGGCSDPTPEKAESPLPVALSKAQAELALEKDATRSEHQRAIDADHALSQAKGLLATAQDEAAAAHFDEDRAKEEARLAPLRTTAHWVEGLMLLGATLAGAAAAAMLWFGVPFGAKIAGGFAIGFGGGFAIAIGFGIALSHPFIVGGVVVAAIVAGALWFLYHHIQLKHVAGEFRAVGDEALAALESRRLQDGMLDPQSTDLARSIRNGAANRQLRSGIQHLVDRSLTSLRAAAKRVA